VSDIRHVGKPTTGKWIERWSIGSDTRDAEYIVAVDAGGNYGCSCPAWKFQRKRMLAKNPAWTCKHIQAVLVWRGMSSELPVTTKVNIGSLSVRMIDLDDLD